MRPLTITSTHLARCAVIYLRQSTVFQVQHHTGSTSRQYQLQEQAQQWGWPADQIVIIDDDLGSSGTGASVRAGFQQMLTLIQADRVGAVFVVHENRLARNIWDFVQFLTACEYHQVLVVVEGVVKDPREDRDRLLTLLMGAFAEHENRDRMHQLRSAMRAKMHAEKNAMSTPPTGYEAPVEGEPGGGRRRRWGARWIKDPDPAVGVHNV